MLALSFMVLETTGSAARMGVVLFAGMLPLVAAGLFSGVVVDRVDRKAVIIVTDILRGVIVSVVSLLYFKEALTFGLILVSQVLLGLNSAFFNPAIPSVIPMIVPKADLSKANAKTQFVSGFANIAGPALGGILVSIYGYLIVFALNAATYFVSAFFECFLNIPSVKTEAHESLVAAFKEGYRTIYADRKLLVILFMVFVIHFFVGSIEVAIPVIAGHLPGSGPANMGYIQTAFGTGAVIMALGAKLFQHPRPGSLHVVHGGGPDRDFPVPDRLFRNHRSLPDPLPRAVPSSECVHHPGGHQLPIPDPG